MRVEDIVRAYRTKLGASMTRSGDHVRFYIDLQPKHLPLSFAALVWFHR
jgi:hypothetical protein